MAAKRYDLILGSASPRRLELLSRFFKPESIQIAAVELDETALIEQQIHKNPNARFGMSSSWAARIAEQLAQAKMDALQPGLINRQADYVAVTADTIVVLGDHILGKPSDASQARSMLELLSGRDHAVLTGVCVQASFNDQIQQFTSSEMTIVTFAMLTPEKIDWYIATGEPFDKAGAYGIQGYGSALVKSITGCYYNVMGLPIYRLLDLFGQVQDAFPSVRDQFKLLPW